MTEIVTINEKYEWNVYSEHFELKFQSIQTWLCIKWNNCGHIKYPWWKGTIWYIGHIYPLLWLQTFGRNVFNAQFNPTDNFLAISCILAAE